jgi:hypothetical protein
MTPEFAIVAGTAAVVVIAAQVVRLRRVEAAHRTLQEALRGGAEPTPELIAAVGRVGGETPWGLWGAVLVALALAVAAFGLIQGDADDIRNAAGFALFPLALGLVLLGRSLVRGRGGDR